MAAVLGSERDWLLARIAEEPDLTLRAIVAERAARGMRVSYDAVWRALLQTGEVIAVGVCRGGDQAV